MSTSVKHIHSGMRGAPTINGTAGPVIAALDALFVTGWGATTALSVTVAGGIATAQLTPGETFDRTAVVLVAGATPAELNGESRVLTSGNTAITWATTAADGVATGTITIKYAPQTSWQKVFAGTNKAAYRSNHVQSNGHFLRIDDTGTTTCRVRGYESMTDVDTGTGPFPTDAQMSGGGYLWKSTVASATASPYRIFCDERFLVLAIAAGVVGSSIQKAAPPRGFGDPIALAPGGDGWATLICAAGSSSSAPGTASFVNGASIGSATAGMTLSPRLVTGLGGSVANRCAPFTGTLAGTSGADASLGTMPSQVDGQIKTSKMFAMDAATGAPRSVVPGVLFIPQSGYSGVLNDGDILDGAVDLSGRKLMVVFDSGSASGSFTPQGAYLVDITGPWR